MYIPLDLNFFDNPKLLDLAKLSHKKCDTCGLKVIKLWLYCAKFYQSGDVTLLKGSQSKLKKALGMQGAKAVKFFDSMITVGFIDDDGKCLMLHDWNEQGYGLLAKKIDQRKKTNAGYYESKKDTIKTSYKDTVKTLQLEESKVDISKEKKAPLPPFPKKMLEFVSETPPFDKTVKGDPLNWSDGNAVKWAVAWEGSGFSLDDIKKEISKAALHAISKHKTYIDGRNAKSFITSWLKNASQWGHIKAVKTQNEPTDDNFGFPEKLLSKNGG